MIGNRRFVCAVGVIFALANLQLNGCSKSSSAPNDIAFACDVEPKPPRVGPNIFTVRLGGSHGEQIAGAHVSLEGNMSHAGMGPVFGEAKEIALGEYRGTLDLNMRGDWVVLFHITLANGRTVERQIQIQNLKAT
jgi:hypothetical protein